MVAHEKQSTTASRLENILAQKWFERPTDYKIMTKLSSKKNDRVLDLIDSRGNRTWIYLKYKSDIYAITSKLG